MSDEWSAAARPFRVVPCCWLVGVTVTVETCFPDIFLDESGLLSCLTSHRAPRAALLSLSHSAVKSTSEFYSHASHHRRQHSG
jgi:hypothetical protein